MSKSFMVGSPKHWDPINTVKETIWTILPDGTEVRSGTSASIMQSTRDMINNLYGECSRPIFGKAQQSNAVANIDLDPLYEWRYVDGNPNGRTRTAIYLCTEKPYTQSDANSNLYDRYVEGKYDAYGWAVSSFGIDQHLNTDWINHYGDMYRLTYHEYRNGAATYAEVNGGCKTVNNLRILDCYVEELTTGNLSSQDKRAIPPDMVPGEPVTARQIKLLRDALHTIRKNNNPIVLSWAAQCTNYTPSAPGDQTCITISGDSYVNLFDQTITDRNGVTPGACFDAYAMGVGPEGGHVNTRKVKVVCRVLGTGSAVLGSGNINVKFEGPEFISGNETVITIDDNNLAWHGTDDNYIFLDSMANIEWTNDSKNKIDIFGETEAGDLGYIYGLRAWVVYDGD